MKQYPTHLFWRPAILLSFLLFLQLPAHAATINLPTEQPVPGGIVIIPIIPADTDNARPTIHFQAHRVMVVKSSVPPAQWLAIVGIPRSAKTGAHSIKIQQGKQHRTQQFHVERKLYPEQRIQITNKRLVNPEKRDMNRITKESQIMKRAFTSWSESGSETLRMDWPVSGPISSPFGLTRFFNNQPRKPHSGIDIAAPKGSDIQAPRAGKVVATGNFFFNGNTVLVDHGQGLISLFCHLDRIETTNGAMLERGEKIGTVGQTGRATGPHLHWSLNLNNVRIDPMLFLDEPLNTAKP
ncbi:MAG: peptidoglycan DD-metalloendopeptidase family protein [Pseudomonadales bacterium]|nr:peptidoglycan DD-metalloendopeptidase family protein [Pseudomonadales bacterium]